MANDKYKIIIAKSVDEFITWLLKVGRSGYRIAYEFSKDEKIVKILAIEKRGSSDYKRKFYS